MAWADFMPLGQVAARFVLIGDPGQIAPVVAINTSRWETSPVPPHFAAPHTILERFTEALDLRLPATRRLPHDSARLVQPFYDFEFGAFAEAGDRQVIPSGGGHTPADGAIDRLATGSVVGLTVPTPAEGPPLERDDLVVQAAVQVGRLLQRRTEIRIDGRRQLLQPNQIGVCATHHVMNSALHLGLPSRLRADVKVETPERWQGLERPVMVVVHPLSGKVRPSSFDLDTGRLCVMASRQQAGLVILSRDHVTETLNTHLPTARQAVGRPDVEGRGHSQNTSFWTSLLSEDRIVA